MKSVSTSLHFLYKILRLILRK